MMHTGACRRLFVSAAASSAAKLETLNSTYTLTKYSGHCYELFRHISGGGRASSRSRPTRASNENAGFTLKAEGGAIKGAAQTTLKSAKSSINIDINSTRSSSNNSNNNSSSIKSSNSSNSSRNNNSSNISSNSNNNSSTSSNSGGGGGVSSSIKNKPSKISASKSNSISASDGTLDASSKIHPDIRQADIELHPINGIFAVYKSKGKTSAKIVDDVKYALQDELFKLHNRKIKVKMGHGGTLDPMAEGVLVIGVGAGTRELTSFLSGSKAYKATAAVGAETDSLDATGKVVKEVDCSHLTLNQLNVELPNFMGKIMQTPPAFSAVHHNGERAYKIALKGETVELKPKEVVVYKINLLPEESDLPRSFSVDIECGGGFYVRSFLADLAKRCGALANMSALVRTKQGQFTLQDCLHQENWTVDNVKQAIDNAARIPKEI